MREKKLRELVLFLIAIILLIFLIKYLNVFKYIKLLFSMIMPLIIGFIYSWIFNPFIRKLSKRYNRNVVCICFFLIFIFFIGLFLYYLIPIIYKEIMELVKMLPDIFSKIQVKIDKMGFKDYIDRILLYLVDNVPKLILSFVKSIFKYLGVFFIGLILGLYISFDYDKIVSKLFKLLPQKFSCVLSELFLKMSEDVRKCVNGTLLVAFLVFLMSSLAFFIIGLEAPLLFGMLCGITDLIPYIGPYIGGILAVIVGFTESNFIGIGTIIICFVVQSIENYVLQPIIMSKRIEISPIMIIIGLLVFGRLFGIIGMIMATPILSIIKVLLNQIPKVKNKCFD